MSDFLSSSQWLYFTIHNSPCKVIEKQSLWGQTICRVWLPGSDAVVKVPPLLPGIMGGGV